MTTPAGRSWRSSAALASLLPAGGLAVLLTLGFDSVPGLRTVQVAPWSGMLAVLLMPVALLLGGPGRRTPVRDAVLTFATFAVAHSLVALGVEAAGGGLSHLRLLAWARQVAALGAGVSVFLVTRSALGGFGERRALVAMLVGAVPTLAVAGLSVVASVSGQVVFLGAEKGIRRLFVPLGFTWEGRASGLALEPSYLAFFLAVVALPAAVGLVVAGRGRTRAWAGAGLAAVVLALVATFSATGFFVVATMLAGAALTRWRRVAVWTATAIVVTALALVAWFPGNYLAHRLLKLAEGVGRGGVGQMDVSALNTAAGAVGPFLRTTSSLVALGYGLGGTSTHLDDILPAGWARGVRRVSWAGMPNLRSLTGRIYAECGIVGLALFVALFLTAARSFRRRAPATAEAAACRWLGPLVLGGLFAGYALKYGSFATPYLWVWLALADGVVEGGGAWTGTAGHGTAGNGAG